MIRYILWSLIAIPVSLTMQAGVRYTDSLRWDVMRSLIRKRDGYKCRGCGSRSLYGQNWLECHHRRRVADGGSYLPWNLRLLCKACHDVETSAQNNL